MTSPATGGRPGPDRAGAPGPDQAHPTDPGPADATVTDSAVTDSGLADDSAGRTVADDEADASIAGDLAGTSVADDFAAAALTDDSVGAVTVVVDGSGVEIAPGDLVVADVGPLPVADPWSGTVIDAVPTTADDIAVRVLAVPGVVRLHAGRFGEVATYLPGRRVTGIKLGDEVTEVHVVVAAHAPIRETAQLIHAAVATLTGPPVHVHVEDIAVA